MKNWITLGTAAAVALTSASCGKNDSNEQQGDAKTSKKLDVVELVEEVKVAEVVEVVEGFSFPEVDAEHVHMHKLLANAMSYIDPKHGLIDEASGYPLEGWNQDPSRGLYLRSFTQLTSMGEWVEVLANIAAGYADNPYVSRERALEKLEHTVNTLLADQQDPAVSSKGLLGNFLGLKDGKRLGPLGEDVSKSELVEVFGQEKAAAIWGALAERGWITPVQGGKEGKIKRGAEYGARHFTGPLEPFAADAGKIMEILDERVVKVIWGDNVNLTSSVAKAAGALMHPQLKDNAKAAELVAKMEQFINAQKDGYIDLFNPETDTFTFGKDASRDQFVGWEDMDGNWVVGHQNYFINEFRGPFMFCFLKYGWPINSIKNASFKMMPYRMADGRELYTLATWHGSSFQALGLTQFMNELSYPGWAENMKNQVAIEVDFATKLGNPGFLSESYSGRGVEYTGDVGVPDIAVSQDERIIDAPSLYTLGVSYMVAPEKIENFLKANWQGVSALFTDHGPWEGTLTSTGEPIKFQTSAHTMSLILGGINTGNLNMQRYLAAHGLVDKLVEFNKPGDAFNFFSPGTQHIVWTASGDALEIKHEGQSFNLHGEKVRFGGVSMVMPNEQGHNLSNGTLKISYQAAEPMPKSLMIVKRAANLPIKPIAFENEIFTRFDKTEGDEVKTIEVPLPGTPNLHNVKELVLVFGEENVFRPIDLTIKQMEFIPAGE